MEKGAGNDGKVGSPRSRGRRWRPNWVEVAGVLIPLAGLVVAIIALRGSDAHGHSAPRLVVDDLVVHEANGKARPRSGLEVIVHNKGGQRTVIDRARIAVLRVYPLHVCSAQGDLPVSYTYGVALPPRGAIGRSFTVPLHDEAGADEADRFRLALSVNLPTDKRDSFFLFELGVGLHDDAASSDLAVGKALISLPYRPEEGEDYWGRKTPQALSQFPREFISNAMSCWQGNTRMLRRALASSATRTKQLGAIADDLVTPSFARLE
jgi:hypothetical protein